MRDLAVSWLEEKRKEKKDKVIKGIAIHIQCYCNTLKHQNQKPPYREN